MVKLVRFFLWILIILLVIGGLAAWLLPGSGKGVAATARSERIMQFLTNPSDYQDWLVKAGQRCGEAPFSMPTDGYIGFIWDDSFRPGHRHSGIDMFGGREPGVTPVYAAADGYLTRLPEWKSSLIIRIPEDPLLPGRTIWTYYTHIANPDGSSLIAADFPAGTQDVFITAGTLLGYQGNFSGTPGAPTGVHLHFSIVLGDSQGQFLNELDIDNTLDPSPYLGLDLNAHTQNGDIPLCPPIAEEDQP